jgi:hypothetical protein
LSSWERGELPSFSGQQPYCQDKVSARSGEIGFFYYLDKNGLSLSAQASFGILKSLLLVSPFETGLRVSRSPFTLKGAGRAWFSGTVTP